MNSKSNNLINLKVPKKLKKHYLGKWKADVKTETHFQGCWETLNNVNGSFSNCDFNITIIVVVKHSTALHLWSSKANQGRPKECKGCFF